MIHVVKEMELDIKFQEAALVGNVADMSPRVVATPTMSSKNWPT